MEWKRRKLDKQVNHNLDVARVPNFRLPGIYYFINVSINVSNVFGISSEDGRDLLLQLFGSILEMTISYTLFDVGQIKYKV